MFRPLQSAQVLAPTVDVDLVREHAIQTWFISRRHTEHLVVSSATTHFHDLKSRLQNALEQLARLDDVLELLLLSLFLLFGSLLLLIFALDVLEIATHFKLLVVDHVGLSILETVKFTEIGKNHLALLLRSDGLRLD